MPAAQQKMPPCDRHLHEGSHNRYSAKAYSANRYSAKARSLSCRVACESKGAVQMKAQAHTKALVHTCCIGFMLVK